MLSSLFFRVHQKMQRWDSNLLRLALIGVGTGTILIALTSQDVAFMSLVLAYEVLP